MISEKIKENREKITNQIIDGLNKEGLKFIKRWNDNQTPRNGLNENTKYKGGNKLNLEITALYSDYKDPRWLTFKQAQAKGLTVKKGSKGVMCEKWIFSKKIKEIVNGKEVEKEIQLKSPYINTFTLFNGEQIEGLEPYIPPKPLEIRKYSDIIENLEKSSEVKILYEPQDRAYYSPMKDIIVLPEKEAFISEEWLISTLTHEMGHSTGHETRLNRFSNLENKTEYAEEELRVELASIYTGKELGVETNAKHFESHQSYINGWISLLKDDPDTIYRVVAEAEKISDRMMKNYESILEKSVDKSLDGYKKIYHENGALKTAVLKEIFGNNPVDGKRKTFYENGNIRSQETLTNGKRDKEYIEYNKLGEIQKVTKYEKNKKEIETEYRNGEKHGIETVYHEKGYIETPFFKGEIEGTLKKYNENKDLIEEENYMSNKMYSRIKIVNGLKKEQSIYYENGAIESITSFEKEKKEGEAISYYENGTIANKTEFKNGKRHGTEKKYDREGQLWETNNYKNGEYIIETKVNPLLKNLKNQKELKSKGQER
jgi:antirestriction protein ArdC/antitoxin component YwqK of YwqJK toxin-antitoxin module